MLSNRFGERNGAGAAARANVVSALASGVAVLAMSRFATRFAAFARMTLHGSPAAGQRRMGGR